MPTDLIEVDPNHPAPGALARAGSIIRGGGVVAIPTDALYTLVADPFNLHAVLRVFQAKGRESVRALPLVRGAGANPFTPAEKARQKSFKARHADNIAKGKMSAAYWADKVKW